MKHVRMVTNLQFWNWTHDGVAFAVHALGDSQTLLTCAWLSPARCPRNHTAPLLSLLLGKHKPYTTTCCRAGSRPHSRISAFLKFLVLRFFGIEPTNFPNIMAAATLKTSGHKTHWSNNIIFFLFWQGITKKREKVILERNLVLEVCNRFSTTKSFVVNFLIIPCV